VPESLYIYTIGNNVGGMRWHKAAARIKLWRLWPAPAGAAGACGISLKIWRRRNQCGGIRRRNST